MIVCSIENLDPMGVHTGDSITVAPAMTLTDREYQHLRDLSIGIIRSVGVDTGGCNIQFAVNPDDGRVVVIEMNPRVSRSSALASKATGFPIAKIAAKVAIGYTLDEIPNDITRETPGVVRADAGLHRGEGAAVRVREVPERRPDPDHAHEVGRRGDGDRPQLHRGAAEGAALAGEQGRRLRLAQGVDRPRQARAARGDQGPARRPAEEGHGRHPGRCVARGDLRLDRDRPVVRRPADADQRDRRRAVRRRRAHARAAAQGQAARLLRRAGRQDPRLQRRRGARGPARAWASGRSTRPWTPAPPSSPRPRRTTTRRTTRRRRSRPATRKP